MIVPAFNASRKVVRCLTSLRHFAHDPDRIELLVQDDASLACDFRSLLSPRIANVERNPENVGFAATCNAGALRAEGELLLFVNQDVYAHPAVSRHWDDVLLSSYREFCWSVWGPLLLFQNGSVQSAGGFFDRDRRPFHRFLGLGDRSHPAISYPRLVSWITGAVMAVPRDFFTGFDVTYPGGYFEDADFCLHARARGGIVQYDPRTAFVHEVGSTGGNPALLANERRFLQRWRDSIVPDTDYSGV